MSIFIRQPYSANWHEQAETFLREGLRRYRRGEDAVAIRSPRLAADKAPFAALVHRHSPTSAGYGGTSLALFPGEHRTLISFVVGTQGLAPDEAILTRPGHARLCRAGASWVNATGARRASAAWSKAEPTRIDQELPRAVAASLSGLWQSAIEKYGRFIYLSADLTGVDEEAAERIWLALLDLYMNERGIEPLASVRQEVLGWRNDMLANVLPAITLDTVQQLVAQRRYVILEGPPGTGKTRMALHLLADAFGGHGSVHQFHSGTGYEQFVGGLAPTERNGHFGFRPAAGILMEASAAAAQDQARPYLLVLDEVNRADLARALGEALFLFEPQRPGDVSRTVALAYDFGQPWGSTLSLPANLRVLGTMNSADRSTAILDLAVRRRFAFAHLWPARAALDVCPELARTAFDRLLTLFVDEASDAALELIPGHAYFLAADDAELRSRLRTELAPLLTSYLRQGLVPGLEDTLDSYLQWLSTV